MKKAKHIFSSIIATVALMGSGLFAQVGPEPTEAHEGVPFWVAVWSSGLEEVPNEEARKELIKELSEEFSKMVFKFEDFEWLSGKLPQVNNIVKIGTVNKDSEIYLVYQGINRAHALVATSAWIEGGPQKEFVLLENGVLRDKFRVQLTRFVHQTEDGEGIIFNFFVAVLKADPILNCNK